MKNDLLTIGPFTIHGYGLMIALGVIAAYMVGEYRAKKQKLDPEFIMGFILSAVIGGLAGAKVLYWLTRIQDILADPSILLNLKDGFVVYGGIIAGIFCALLYCKIKQIAFFKYFDLLVPSVALGQAFGRIGCFLAGCCYGKETDSVIGIVFKESMYAPNGVKLLPTQLISSGLDILNCLALIYISRKKKGDGQVLGFYLVFYSIGRFFLEFLRGDLIRGSVGALSTSQFIAVFMCLAGILLILYRKGKIENAVDGKLVKKAEEVETPAEEAEPEAEAKPEAEAESEDEEESDDEGMAGE